MLGPQLARVRARSSGHDRDSRAKSASSGLTESMQAKEAHFPASEPKPDVVLAMSHRASPSLCPWHYCLRMTPLTDMARPHTSILGL